MSLGSASNAQPEPQTSPGRRWLAGALIGAWVAVTVTAFWHYEFQFLLPVSKPAEAKVLRAGTPSPVSTLRTLDGAQVEVGRGTPTVLHFWSPDCPCSRFNEPAVKQLAAENPGVRVLVVIETADLSPSLAKRVRERFPFPAVHDADGAIAKAFGAYATPAASLIDAEGKVQYVGTYMATAMCSSNQTDAVQVALKAMMTGKNAPEGTPAYGCALPQR